ncbi:MAG TPA: HU family DNA-binding protein [Candidatus Nitrosotalea sp.]|nr:HU family DNA-binding protein [Candidatus Nitrosotalea sp.]
MWDRGVWPGRLHGSTVASYPWGTMNKSDLVEEVARVAGLTRHVSDAVVTAVFERIIDALKQGERVDLRGLGTFTVRRRRARVARNPKTGVRVDVPARAVPFFKMGKELQAILNPGAEDEKTPPAGSLPMAPSRAEG